MVVAGKARHVNQVRLDEPDEDSVHSMCVLHTYIKKCVAYTVDPHDEHGVARQICKGVRPWL